MLAVLNRLPGYCIRTMRKLNFTFFVWVFQNVPEWTSDSGLLHWRIANASWKFLALNILCFTNSTIDSLDFDIFCVGIQNVPIWTLDLKSRTSFGKCLPFSKRLRLNSLKLFLTSCVFHCYFDNFNAIIQTLVTNWHNCTGRKKLWLDFYQLRERKKKLSKQFCL